MKLSITTKRYILYINVAIFRLLVSVEYAIIMPTLWSYLSSQYKSSSIYFGLCLSGFHMGCLPSSLIFGLLNDLKFKVKTLVIFGNFLQVSAQKRAKDTDAHSNANMAVNTTASVACCWAGALMQIKNVTKRMGAGQPTD